VGIRNCPNVVL